MILNQKIGKFTYLCGKSGVPGLIMSDPGIGKSSTLELYAKIMNMNLTVLIASQYAPDDILGIQSVVDGKLERLSPAWFNQLVELSKNGKPNLLFIDELTGCDEFIQMPMLELIRTKQLGIHSLPKNTQVIAAGNYEEQLNRAFKMSMPMVNRFVIMNIHASDVSTQELLEGTFRKVLESDESVQREFIGLSKNGVWKDKNAVKRLISNNVSLEVRMDNSSETGLVGFSSVRSIQNAFDFIEASQEEEMVDDIVVQCLSATLGPGKNTNFRSALTQFVKSTSKSDPRSVTVNDIKTMDKNQCNSYVNKLIELKFIDLTPAKYVELKNASNEGRLDRELFDKVTDAITRQ